jgi:5-methylcytosine-specific restriction endonuclease McrA
MTGKKLEKITSKRRRRLRLRIYQRDQGICQICFIRVPFHEATMDHYPVKRRDGGRATFDNLRLACLDCNWSLEDEHNFKE